MSEYYYLINVNNNVEVTVNKKNDKNSGKGYLLKPQRISKIIPY